MNKFNIADSSLESPYYFFQNFFSLHNLKNAFTMFIREKSVVREAPYCQRYDDLKLMFINIYDPYWDEEKGERVDGVDTESFEDFLRLELTKENKIFKDFVNIRFDSYSGKDASEIRILFLKEILGKIKNSLLNIQKITNSDISNIEDSGVKKFLIKGILAQGRFIQQRIDELSNESNKEQLFVKIIKESSKLLFKDNAESIIFSDVFISKIWSNPFSLQITNYDLKSITYLFFLIKKNELRVFKNTKIVNLKLFIGNKSKVPITQSTYDATKTEMSKSGCKYKAEIDSIFLANNLQVFN